MATRGTFAVQHQDGTISAVYSHWDNYPEHNGRLLVENYNSLELAEQLISLGSISSLQKTLNPTNTHSFESPQDNVTIAYSRDRGEDLVIQKYESLESYFLSNDWQEYNYLWTEYEFCFEQYNNRRYCWFLVIDKSLKPVE